MLKGYKLFNLNKRRLQNLTPVTSTAVLDGGRFDSNGLYSREIFGDIGSDVRLKSPSYIDMNIDIIHPYVYDSLLKLGKIYSNVAKGITKAKVVNGYLEVDEDGETGMTFLMKILPTLKYKSTGADTRDDNITVVTNAAKDNALFTQYYYVIPVGLREVQFTDGRPEETEVNELYKKLIIVSRSTKLLIGNRDATLADPILYKLQHAASVIHDYFLNSLNGKHKRIRGKYTKRAITGSTRNVITAHAPDIESLKKIKFGVGMNNVVVGLYQTAKALQPVVKQLLTDFLKDRVTYDNATVYNAENGKFKVITPTEADRKLFTIADGIDTLIGRTNNDYHSEGIKIGLDKYYLSVVYRGEEGIRILDPYEDTTSLDMDRLEPLTYDVLFTYLLAHVKYKAAVDTRYPMTGRGSVIPTIPIVRPTIDAVEEQMLIKGEYVTVLYPTDTEPYRSLSINFTRIAAQGADFDGDKESHTMLYTVEAINQIYELLGSKDYYIGSDGKLDIDLGYGTADKVFWSLTRTDK